MIVVNTKICKFNEDLLNEVDALTKVLHVSRSEWLRNQIFQAVKEEILNLREAIALEYAKGHLSDEELNELLGADAEDVKFIVKHLQTGKDEIDEKIEKGKL